MEPGKCAHALMVTETSPSFTVRVVFTPESRRNLFGSMFPPAGVILPDPDKTRPSSFTDARGTASLFPTRREDRPR